MAETRKLGTVSTDTAGVSLIDPTYLMTDEHHDAGRDPTTLASEYDGLHVATGSDGTFPVFAEYDDSGGLVAIRIDLRRDAS